MAIDREAIKRNIMRGLSIPASVMVAPGVNGNTRDIDVAPKADPDRRQEAPGRGRVPGRLRGALNCPNNRYVNDEEICQAMSRCGPSIGVKNAGGREHGHLHPEGPELRLVGLPAGLGRGHLRRAVHAAVAGAHRTTGADGNFNFSKISDAAPSTSSGTR
jgi:peptide/nickel transport system substrate-binding protein